MFSDYLTISFIFTHPINTLDQSPSSTSNIYLRSLKSLVYLVQMYEACIWRFSVSFLIIFICIMCRNIRVKEIYGSKNRALLRCNTCTHYFSETRGTIFFRLETPDDEILRTLALVSEKGSIRGTAKATGHDRDTICT